MNEIKEKAWSLFISGETNITEISRKLKEERGLDNDVEQIRKYLSRYINKRRKNNALYEEADKIGIDPESINHYWYKGKHFSIHSNNTKNDVSFEEIVQNIIDDMKGHQPKHPKYKRQNSKDGHLLVIDPADVHIGKLAMGLNPGDDYDVNTARKRVIEGVKGILDKSAGYNIDKIAFIGGNDILHIDTPKRTTTSGTPQDTDGMWYHNFEIARKLYVEVLDLLMTVADVHFIFNPSNHDYTNGFFLAQVMQAWYRGNKHISFDSGITHRKYFQYGKNLIGSTHGDGAKQQDLPLLAAHEAAEMWAVTKHRYIYTHHVHHKMSKDHIGVTIESLRSPSGTDVWHHNKGYTGAPKAVEGFIHHKEYGQVARLTHLFV